ncbi:hypothetical protein ACQEVZ_39780 [Dactylosporangium sp. CA-152071]|uniref:hypothetical protein n=1 Tax=Dactylosporangium sp. CA-152071 TaxID=3239933 RepID=UPI003D90114D
MTLFLADVDQSSADLPANCVHVLRDHLAVATGWLAWCRSRFERTPAAASTRDKGMVMDAWRWLRCGRLLAGAGLPDVAYGDEAWPAEEAACQVGLSRARRVVDACLSGVA